MMWFYVKKYYALLELKLLKMLKIFVKEKNLHLNIGLSFQFLYKTNNCQLHLLTTKIRVL